MYYPIIIPIPAAAARHRTAQDTTVNNLEHIDDKRAHHTTTTATAWLPPLRAAYTYLIITNLQV